jgi:6-phosphogluconolactonase
MLTFAQSFSVIWRMERLILFALSVYISMLTTAQENEHYLLIGTYTSSGKSEGIHVFKFNSNTGESVKVSSIATSNPSYLSISPDEKFVYAVHEVDSRTPKGGEISAFAFDKKEGKLSFLNSEPSGGDHPCYVQVDKTGKWVFAGNYTSGSLSVYPVKADGTLGAPSITRHRGSGPNKDRQAGPHVHCTMVSPDNKWLYVPDLGMDKVMIYQFDDKSGKLSPGKQPYVSAEPGGGPRHFVFNPNGKFAYLIEELSGQVAAYKYKNGALTFMERVPSTDPAKKGYAGSADIHLSPDQEFLYASNRGDFDDIVWYKIKPSTGKLSVAGFQSTLGKTPRNFNIDPSGNFLLAANQNSDEIVIFQRNKTTGALTDTGKRITVGQPVCLKWMRINQGN